MYELIIPRSVEKDIRKLPRQLQKIIASEPLESIKSEPHRGKFLRGKSRGLRKYTFFYKGTEYRVSETAKSAILIMVGSRENFYERLERRI
jgi:mRNA-degrading endonuclease RelE of RelBE toxin-antitoxin system